MTDLFNPRHVCAFDLETTGPNPRTARIVTSSCLTTSPDANSPQGVTVTTHNWLADPDCPIPATATAVHGVTTEHAQQHGEDHHKVAADTVALINQAWDDGRTLIVYNGAFDLTILHHWIPSFTINGLVIDPYVIDRALDPYRRGKRTLGVVCEHYNVNLDNAHRSDADAWAAAELARRLTEVFPQLLTTPASELMEQQATWHRERQESLESYFHRQGRTDATVSKEWPLISLTRHTP